MAKLALLALALVALSAVSALRITTITTETIQDNHIFAYPYSDGLENRRDQCPRQIPIEQLNHCQMHLTQLGGILKMVVNPRVPFQEQQHLQQCCSQLQQVSPQCQCDAIQQVFDQSRQQADVIRMRQMLSKAKRLPNDCSLEVQDCPVRAPRV